MTPKCLQLELQTGYTVAYQSDTVDLDRAVEKLPTRRQLQSTMANRTDMRAILIRHRLVCPYCDHRIPAYGRPWDPNPAGRVPRPRVLQWGDPQLTMFGHPDPLLNLQEVRLPEGGYRCEKCGKRSEPAGEPYRVRVVSHRHRITLTCALRGLEDLLDCRWLGERPLTQEGTLYERVTFNFRNGHTHLSLHAQEGDCLAAWDITDRPEDWVGSPTYKLARHYTKVRRALKRRFGAMWGTPLPFGPGETDPVYWILMTRFVGFPRRFFDSLPYQGRSYGIDRDFRATARRVRTLPLVEKTLAGASLPKGKAFRRVLFNDPGLLLYLNEMEQLWAVLADENLLRRVLCDFHNYDILPELHDRPSILVFLRDCVAVKGAPYLVKKMLEDWHRLYGYGLNYYCMSPRARQKEQANWKKGDLYNDLADTGYSVPMAPLPPTAVDCTVYGYRFRWLRSQRDYREAGAVLRNCLVEWGRFQAPVLCVSYRERVLAALQVRHGRITQFLGYKNEPVSDPSLLAAFDWWRARMGLEWSAEEPEELPF